MTTRATWRWCAAAGLLTFIASSGFGWIGPPQLCGPGFGKLSAVISFELVRSPAEVATLFGAEPCRGAMLSAMRRAQWWDALAFIPAYTAFLMLAAAAITRGRWMWVAGAVLLAGGLLDEVEGALMFAAMNPLPGTQAIIDWLVPVVRTKFALLGIGSAMLGGLLIATRNWLAMVVGAVAAFGAVSSLYGLINLPDVRLTGGLANSWSALLVGALIASVWPSLFSRPPLPARRVALRLVPNSPSGGARPDRRSNFRARDDS